MMQEVVDSILLDMLPVIDNSQLEKLKNILARNLAFLEDDGMSIAQPEEYSGPYNNDIISKFITAKRLEGCSERTLDYYFKIIQKTLFSIAKRAGKITTEDLRGYLTRYQDENKTSHVTVDNIRRILSSFFNWMEEEEYILKSPIRRIHKVKAENIIKEIYTDESLEKMRDFCKTVRDLVIMELLASSGMRIGELVKLNIKDINFNERECIAFGKGNKERVAYFDAKTKMHLLDYIAARKDENEALFVSTRSPHERMTIGGIEVMFRKIGKTLNIGRVHPHKFRRTLATMAIDKGMPIEQLQRLLGHKRIDTTLQYAMVKQNNVKISHKKFIG